MLHLTTDAAAAGFSAPGGNSDPAAHLRTQQWQQRQWQQWPQQRQRQRQQQEGQQRERQRLCRSPQTVRMCRMWCRGPLAKHSVDLFRLML
jgi:hypothetical protein